MTDNEKRALAENARIYHAHTPKKEASKKSTSGRGTGLLCAGGLLLLGMQALSSESTEFIAETAGHAAAELCTASARAELTSINNILTSRKAPEENPEPDNTEMTLTLSGDDANMLSYGSRRMPSSENEEITVEDILPPEHTLNKDTPLPYPEDINDRDGTISSVTYESGSGENYIDLPLGGQIRNVTKLSSQEIYENALLSPDFTIKLNAPADEPQVLIMHTHTTESYEPFARDYFDSDFLSRTTDNSMNMNAVGDVMADVLEGKGIRTYHAETVHDYPSYNGSYDRSRETVAEILEKYPSIKVVLDVHRDAIERQDGERIAPSATINGKSCAQVMIICGCDDGTMNMPDCMKNLRTASLFQQYMEHTYSGLTRPVLYDYRQYNQDLTTGSLLIEVGGHANSIEQALYAGELSADAIADALISISEEDTGGQ